MACELHKSLKLLQLFPYFISQMVDICEMLKGHGFGILNEVFDLL